jgi:hypothetical protein
MRSAPAFALVLWGTAFAAAQQSANFQVEGAVINAAGRPAAGGTASSASFRVSLESIGEAATGVALSSGSLRGEAGFSSAYLPPTETGPLRFTSPERLEWTRDRAAAAFNLYRDALSNLAGLTYGNCLQTHLTDPFAIDPAVPITGDGFFYLVTALNRLVEEGPKGSASSGSLRLGNACP